MSIIELIKLKNPKISTRMIAKRLKMSMREVRRIDNNAFKKGFPIWRILEIKEEFKFTWAEIGCWLETYYNVEQREKWKQKVTRVELKDFVRKQRVETERQRKIDAHLLKLHVFHTDIIQERIDRMGILLEDFTPIKEELKLVRKKKK